MPDEHNPNVDRQLEAEVAVGRAVNAIDRIVPGNVAPLSAGGGGAGGQFRIASVVELDSIIAQWTVIRNKIDSSGDKLRRARDYVEPPAKDEMSAKEAKATRNSLETAIDHNIEMSKYAQGYIDKLTDARNRYQNTEGHNTATVQHSDGA
ncbi:hypothetical protein [Actinokineospora sp.]|uniref:hypothetical protein n=1 Tax=Actinokineospora sp. TaxID=1872133 RepID=UPI003D6A801C